MKNPCNRRCAKAVLLAVCNFNHSSADIFSFFFRTLQKSLAEINLKIPQSVNDFSSFHFSVHKNDDINSIFPSRENIELNYFCTLYLQFERLYILKYSTLSQKYYPILQSPSK